MGVILLMQIEFFTVEEDMEGQRLDNFITEEMEDLSRSQVQNLINEKLVEVDTVWRKASYRLKVGEEVKLLIPKPEELVIKAQNIPLKIIFEDKDIVIIDKAKDLVVHPGPGNLDNTLVNSLLYHIGELSTINGDLRPGIVHRLDKDTSGIMVIAKNNRAHYSLTKQIKEHTMKREYIALVHGVINENLGTIEAPIGRNKRDRKKMAVVAGGKKSTSNYQVLDRFNNYTLVKVQLVTGRTHQIRVHFAYIRHAIVGDPLYGSTRKHFNLDSQALHAHILGFKHPSSGEYVEFKSPLPIYMEDILSGLKK